MDWQNKAAIAEKIARDAGALALDFFRKQDDLVIDQKGHQDFVSQADREVELFVRAALADAFPDDGIVGEEHSPKPGTSGFTWVIDPIDGTANFVSSIPYWCVVLAGVEAGKTRVAITHDPVHDECFTATSRGGAFLNGRPIRVSSGKTLRDGSVAVGVSGRAAPERFQMLVKLITDEGGVIVRNASGALSLAYAAAGRFLGYTEAHMNSWDCLAGQLLIAEAGGVVEDQNADDMIAHGGRIIAAAPEVFDDLLRLSEAAFTENGPKRRG